MDLRSLPSRTLVAYTLHESFAENTQVILDRLGCHILTPEEFAEERRARRETPDAPAVTPDLYLVDEHHLPLLLEAETSSSPVVLFAGEQGVRPEDPRIVAVVRSPAGMHDLYRVIQQLLEENPRSTPRIATELEAECRHGGHAFSGSVTSLSENGCLLQSEETLPLGREMLVSFALPQVGKLHVRAETAYELRSCLGLVFSSTSAQIREAITTFVTRTLVDADPATPVASG